LSYADYAKKSFQELFLKEIIDNSIKTAVMQESIVAINKGNGKFEIQLSQKKFNSLA
jgi:hypothetical protein